MRYSLTPYRKVEMNISVSVENDLIKVIDQARRAVEEIELCGIDGFRMDAVTQLFDVPLHFKGKGRFKVAGGSVSIWVVK